MFFSKVLAVAALATSVYAHPGDDIHEEVQRRREHLFNPVRRTIQHCQSDLHESGHTKRMFERRMARAEALRQEKGLPTPEEQPFLHHDDLQDLGSDQILQNRDDMLFGRASNCILDPEATEGPYWVAGEMLRTDLLEGTKGVNLHLDIEVINVNTCKPMADTYVELWGANSTGVYTGVVAKGNGAGTAVPSEIKNSALRGITKTNATGVAEFLTVVPGHYVGRCNHIHTIIHQGATELPNKTISGGTITHVGQFYFDQALLSTVEKTVPYNTNTQAQTQNAADALYKTSFQGGDSGLVNIVMMGTKVEDGLYGYITVGVNPSKTYKPNAVNQWTKDGGVPIKGSPWAGYPWTKKEKKDVNEDEE